MPKTHLFKRDTVFTTGATLQPVLCTINGKTQWRWVVVDFKDDTFLEGQNVVVNAYADTLQGLLAEEE